MDPAYFLIAIVIITIIIINVIRVNKPSSKLNKAIVFIQQNKFIEAQSILYKIILKHPYAVTKYSECFFLQGEELKKQNKSKEAIYYYNKTIESKSLLGPNSDKKSYSNIEEQAYFQIATLQYEVIPKNNTKSTIHSIKNNITYINQSGFSKTQNFNELIEKHNLRIADIYYELGFINEREQNIIDAKNYYSITINTLNKISKNQTYYNAITRAEICKLKLNENIDHGNLNNIKKVSKAFQQNFYYRYSIHLIKHNDFSDAEKIIDNEFDNDNLEIQSLKEICLNEKIKSAVAEITNINSQIKKLYTASSSVEETLFLYNSISEKAKELNKIIPGVQTELVGLKPSLFNRILQSYNEQEKFGKIINLIRGYPEFYNSPILLKNIGNSCVNYLRKNKITDKNYKLLIAMFLTSAYSDNVMLYSLEETLWDDEYTFSLSDSIGSSYEIHSQLPENVNYNEVTETNISIGESQRFLISQFESLLLTQDIESDFLNKIQSFYDSEKTSIEAIIGIIPNEIIFATPYFAKQFNIANSIIDELEHDYTEYKNEESLNVGIAYLFDNRDLWIKEYFEAKKTIDELTESIRRNDLDDFKQYLTSGRKTLIIKFESISKEIEDKLVSVLNTLIKQSETNESLIQIIKEAIKISPTKEKLKYQYANFVTNLCLKNVFENKTLENHKALEYMKDAYLINRDNYLICKNIILFINNNLFDIINNTTEYDYYIFSILDILKQNISKTLSNNASLLQEARQNIISQLPKDSLQVIISGINLNPEGERLKECLDYMEYFGESKSVEERLALLRDRIAVPRDLRF